MRASVTFPAGTPFEVTNKYVIKMSDKAKELQDKYRDEDGQSVILNILATTGGRGGSSNTGSVRYEIMPAEKRE